jgi:hypothetical protein
MPWSATKSAAGEWGVGTEDAPVRYVAPGELAARNLARKLNERDELRDTLRQVVCAMDDERVRGIDLPDAAAMALAAARVLIANIDRGGLW